MLQLLYNQGRSGQKLHFQHFKTKQNPISTWNAFSWFQNDIGMGRLMPLIMLIHDTWRNVLNILLICWVILILFCSYFHWLLCNCCFLEQYSVLLYCHNISCKHPKNRNNYDHQNGVQSGSKALKKFAETPTLQGFRPLRPPRGSVKLIFTKVINCVSLEQFNHKHSIVVESLQWQKVYRLGEDELHRPPVVALNLHFFTLLL